MRRCFKCGGALYRIKRTFRERLRYATLYKCKQCNDYTHDDQWYMLLFGDASRCPQCGTYRIYTLKSRDKIDRMYRNPLSYLQKFAGAELRWCSFCRLQFYDRRPRISTPLERTQAPPAPPPLPANAIAATANGLSVAPAVAVAGPPPQEPVAAVATPIRAARRGARKGSGRRRPAKGRAKSGE